MKTINREFQSGTLRRVLDLNDGEEINISFLDHGFVRKIKLKCEVIKL